MKKVIDDFNRSPEFPENCKISSKNALKIIDACQRISYVCSNYMTPAKIVSGYLKCGQHVAEEDSGEIFDDDEDENGNVAVKSTISFGRIMSQSYCDLDQDFAVYETGSPRLGCKIPSNWQSHRCPDGRVQYSAHDW